jgi:hypothetical protein
MDQHKPKAPMGILALTSLIIPYNQLPNILVIFEGGGGEVLQEDSA